MNPTKHSEVSARKRGGKITDYLRIHSFLDHTKTLCTDGRHRVLHNHWAIEHIVIPIFGVSIVNSHGRLVDVKDMLEQDHILSDYQGNFVPTLSDFVSSIDDTIVDKNFQQRVTAFHQQFASENEVSALMLSPLAITGQLKSLLITHNSWFINSILPQVLDTSPCITEFTISPDMLFNSMQLEPWMTAGEAIPPSVKRREVSRYDSTLTERSALS